MRGVGYLSVYVGLSVSDMFYVHLFKKTFFKMSINILFCSVLILIQPDLTAVLEIVLKILIYVHVHNMFCFVCVCACQ